MFFLKSRLAVVSHFTWGAVLTHFPHSILSIVKLTLCYFSSIDNIVHIIKLHSYFLQPPLLSTLSSPNLSFHYWITYPEIEASVWQINLTHTKNNKSLCRPNIFSGMRGKRSGLVRDPPPESDARHGHRRQDTHQDRRQPLRDRPGSHQGRIRETIR